jgi:hypothetical protein
MKLKISKIEEYAELGNLLEGTYFIYENNVYIRRTPAPNYPSTIYTYKICNGKGEHIPLESHILVQPAKITSLDINLVSAESVGTYSINPNEE